MKCVLIVTTSYASGTSGAEAAGVFVADFAAALARWCRVIVCAPGQADSERVRGGVTVREFGVPTKGALSLLNLARPTDAVAAMRVMRAGRRAVLLAGKDFEPDYTLACWVLPSGYWARCLQRQRGTPYAVWALGSDIWSLGRIPLVRSVLAGVARQASLRFADGLLLNDQVQRLAGAASVFLPSSRCLNMDEPVPAAKPAPPFRLAYLGRFHANKGVDLLLGALQRLSDEEWGAIDAVRIAGGGPLLDLVAQSVRQLAAAGRPVRLEGYKGTAEARELIAWADVVLIPSRVESIPVIFSDAMQMHRPVIAMPVGDLPRLVEKYRVGRCASAVNPEAFARMLGRRQLIEVASCAPATVLAARDFDLRATARRFLDLAGIQASG